MEIEAIFPRELECKEMSDASGNKFIGVIMGNLHTRIGTLMGHDTPPYALTPEMATDLIQGLIDGLNNIDGGKRSLRL
ncbi:TPA: hypothetical protein ACIK6T_002810 [Yersinia enterocolitica]